MISKSISVSKQVNKLSLGAKLLFTWLIPHCDDWGRMTGDPEVIKAIVFPMDNDYNPDIIEKCLIEMVSQRLIIRYVDDGEQYLCLPKWEIHQGSLTRRTDSKIPEPPPNSNVCNEVQCNSVNRNEVQCNSVNCNEVQCNSVNRNEVQCNSLKFSEEKRGAEKRGAEKREAEKRREEKRRAEKRRTSPSAQPLVAHFIDCLTGKLGEKPLAFNPGQAGQFLKKLLMNGDSHKLIISIIDYYLSLNDNFYAQKGWSFSCFQKDYDALKARMHGKVAIKSTEARCSTDSKGGKYDRYGRPI